jgi:hypothetical protein
MECFVHEGKAAVALCKNCARGICLSCAVPVTNGYACSSHCAPLAESLTQLQLTSIRNTGLYQSQRLFQALAATALTAVGANFAYHYPHDYLGWVFLGVGLLFAVLLLRSIRVRH